ncbi:DUF2953 domain-containing protein [Brevibacillus choshinensis]|uniref:DUF2953 domain-containing protein n=1 Tax=Brevibacillus choshinensis TaxID=54911 RepID=A0ABX7FKC2_BRECH|nr:DUF2953 domain-containing protein [Brevibacillus choshinensis]QRG66089.1 DUF2953 domain-containing protein [Brevibacillus choshinensis]
MSWLIVSVIVLVILAFLTPVQISLFYGRIGENDHVVIEVAAWFRLIRRKYEIPMVFLKQSEAGPELVAKVETVQQKSKTKEKIQDLTRKQAHKWYHNYREYLDKIHDFQPMFKELFKHFRCTKLEWHTVMGTGQASETGALTGVVWGVKSILIGVISHAVSLRAIPRMSVQPIWNQAMIRTNFDCVLHFMLGHVIVVTVKMYLRLRKRRVSKWGTAPSEA